MTPDIAALLTSTGHHITVRALSGGLRVAAVWQVLMPVARDIECVRIVANRKLGSEDMTISFAETFAGSLNAILGQLKKMTWVTTAELD